MDAQPKLQQQKPVHLFLICWLAYFAAYIGRLNYSACMAEILQVEGFTYAQGGLISTGLFVTYGIGQLVSGAIGDKVSPKKMMLAGLLASAAANIGMALAHSATLMLVLWSFNGMAQSLTWPPIIRIFSESLPKAYQRKAAVNIATTYVAGALASYVLAAAFIHFVGWRALFVFSAGFMVAVCGVWALGLRQFSIPTGAAKPAMANGAPDATAGGSLAAAPAAKFRLTAFLPLLLPICLAMVMQGVLKDGITSWVPTYISENFHQSAAFAAMVSSVLPLVNLLGVFAANLLRKTKRSEAVVCSWLFLLSAAAAGAILLAGRFSMVLTLVFFALITSAMVTINTLWVNMMPTYFLRFGCVSLVGGILNSSVYLGSSLSSFGIGAVVDQWGWPSLLVVLAVTAAVGGAFCLLSNGRWKQFLAGNAARSDHAGQ